MSRILYPLTAVLLALAAQASAYGTAPESSVPLLNPHPNTCSAPLGPLEASLPVTV